MRSKAMVSYSSLLALGLTCLPLFAVQAMRPVASWYLVDVPLAVCEEPFTANTLIPLSLSLPGRRGQPHVFTVYRTGNEQLSFMMSVLDSKNKQVTSAEVRLDGQSIPSAEPTLTATTSTFTASTATTTATATFTDMGSGKSGPAAISTVTTSTVLTRTATASITVSTTVTATWTSTSATMLADDEDNDLNDAAANTVEVDQNGHVQADPEFIRLLARRPGRALSGKGGRSYGGGYTGGRRGYTGTNSDLRRRGPPPIDSRRRALDSRRRTPSPPINQGWVNPSHPTAGHYNYKPAYHHHHRTSYGYSGYHVYPSGSSLGIGLAGLGGLGVGYAMGSHFGHYRASRWNTMNGGRGFEQCYYQSWQGPCSDCVKRYSMDKCQTSYQLPKAANRDDLMTTAFVPKDYDGPLRVVFSKMQGAEVAKERICPPEGWHWNASLNTFEGTWVAPDTQDVFVTLTPVALEPSNHEPQKEKFPIVTVVVVLVFTVLCCCCAFFFLCDSDYDDRGRRRRSTYGRRRSSYDEFEMQGFRNTATPYTPPAPMMGQVAVPAVAAPIAAPAVAMAVAMPAVATAVATPLFGCKQDAFLEGVSPTGQMWKMQLAAASPALDTSGLLCGPWGDALRAAVLYELQQPGWSREPRFAENGPVGQVIEFLAARGFESFVATAEHTEDYLKQNPSLLSAPLAPAAVAQAFASAPPH